MESSKKIYKSSDVAKFCGVENDTAQKWLVQGKIPAFKTPGGHYRVKEEDLAEFLASFQITSGVKKRRLLIVEDETATRQLIRRLIEKEFPEFEIHEAVDGYEAGFKTKALRPSIVILDLLLPCLNGIRVCRIIRADKSLLGTKIFAVTGYQQERIKKIILRAGADDFLSKPFDTREFIDKIKGLVHQGELSRV